MNYRHLVGHGEQPAQAARSQHYLVRRRFKMEMAALTSHVYLSVVRKHVTTVLTYSASPRFTMECLTHKESSIVGFHIDLAVTSTVLVL